MTEQEQQMAHKLLMDDINKAFKESPIEPTNLQLKTFASKLSERGLRFDPREICKMIDAEAKRQHQELFDSLFKGHHISTLTEAKDQTIKWYNDEEERFELFKQNYIETLNSPVTPAEAEAVAPVVSINSGKKNKKK